MKTQLGSSKQEVLDRTPDSNEEAVLQQMLYSFSKTKLEQMLRVFNEMNTIVLYKTQYRAIAWIDIHTALKCAVELNKPEHSGTEKNTVE